MDKNNLIKLDHKITYNDPYLHEQFKITDEKEKEDLHDVIYKYDLLSIFVDKGKAIQKLINQKFIKT